MSLRKSLMGELRRLNNDELIDSIKKRKNEEIDDYDPLIDYRKRSREREKEDRTDDPWASEVDSSGEQDEILKSAFQKDEGPLDEEMHFDDPIPVGVKEGQGRFDIPGIYDRNNRKGQVIQRDDGKAMTLARDLENAKKKFEWYREEEMRQRIVESDPNYQFVTLVAGEADTPVYKLYDQENIEKIQMREKTILGQHIAHIDRSKSSINELLQQKRELRTHLGTLEAKRDESRSTYDRWQKEFDRYKKQADNYASNYSSRRYIEMKQQFASEYNDNNPTSDTNLLYRLSFDTNAKMGRVVVPLDLVKALLNVELDDMYIFSEQEDDGMDAVLSREQREELNNSMNSGKVAYIKALNRVTARFLFDEWLQEDYPDEADRISGIRNAKEAWRQEVDFVKRHIGTLVVEDFVLNSLVKRDFMQALLNAIIYLLDVDVMSIGEDLPQTDPLSKIDSQRKRNRLWNEFQDTKSDRATSVMESVYAALGGLNYAPEGESQLSEFLTDSFMSIRRSVLTKGPSGEPHPEPVCECMRIYGIYLSRVYNSDEKKVTQYSESIDAIDQNIEDASKNIARVVEPDYPYEHRTAWLARPEHSGTVTLLPSVVAAIKKAYNAIKMFTHLAPIDIEILQTEESIRGDFAALVAVYWARAAQRFPKQYYQTEQYRMNRIEERNLLIRLKEMYERYNTYDERGQVVTRVRHKMDAPKLGKKSRFFAKNHDR